jgi:hypothetical protein
LKQALEANRQLTNESLTNALREYFDPASGKFQERVERLISRTVNLNRYCGIHSLKDRALEESKKDEETRKLRLIQEAKSAPRQRSRLGAFKGRR